MKRPAYLDCPTCPKDDCSGPLVTYGPGGATAGPWKSGNTLRCAACGDDFQASKGAHDRARAADLAFDVFEAAS